MPPAAAAPVRVGGVQVQEIHPNRALLQIHLIQMFQHNTPSFNVFALQSNGIVPEVSNN